MNKMTYDEKVNYFWNKLANLLKEAEENGLCFGFTNRNGEIVYWTDAEETDFSVEPIDFD